MASFQPMQSRILQSIVRGFSPGHLRRPNILTPLQNLNSSVNHDQVSSVFSKTDTDSSLVHFSRQFASVSKSRSKKSVAGSDDNPVSAREEAISQIQKMFGANSAQWLDRDVVTQVPVISTGSITLDNALGVQGLPKGRIVEIYGPEATGKTTLALHVIAEAQKLGGDCAFIDAEHALDRHFSEQIGVDPKHLCICRPDCGEDALEMCDKLVRSCDFSVIVIDSVAALVPRSELDGSMGDPHMALQARLMSQALRKIVQPLNRSSTILIFINQVRSKLQTFGFGQSMEVTTGGNALKFYASVRLNMRKIGTLKDKEEVIGNHIRVKVQKNKVASPSKEAEFELVFGKGISRQGEILDLGTKFGIVTKSGAFYSYKQKSLGQGREKAKAFLLENGNIAEEILGLLQPHMKTVKIVRSDLEQEEDDEETSPVLEVSEEIQ